MNPVEELTALLRPGSCRAADYPDSTWTTIARLMVETFAQETGLKLSHESLDEASLGAGLSVEVWSRSVPAGALGIAIEFRGIAGCDLIEGGAAAVATIALFPYILRRRVQTRDGDEFLEFTFECSSPDAGCWRGGVWRSGEPGEFEYFGDEWP